MKLTAESLLEIVSIIQEGLINGVDISQKLRDLDLEDDTTGMLRLTHEYREKRKKDAPV